MDYTRNEAAHIAKSVNIKGEITGSEDLYFDGELEGSFDLGASVLTIGPNARIRANIHARQVVVLGRIDGDVWGSERVDLKKSAALTGNIRTQRIVIEDGAFFHGAIDIHAPKPVEPPAPVVEAVAANPIPETAPDAEAAEKL